MKSLSVYTVLDFGKPVELSRTGPPAHADMLRYDFAFHDPQDVSRIVFVALRDFRPSITNARWGSFGMTVQNTGDKTDDYLDWITYRTQGNEFLNPITLRDWLADNRDRKLA